MEINTKKIKKFLPYIFLGIIVLLILARIIYSLTVEKKIEIVFPNGGEKLVAGKTYPITWKSQNVGKIGIVLIKGDNSNDISWIAKDISASDKKYNWNIFVWQAPADNYKISIFEYPWKEKNVVDYSEKDFAILGPQFASCDKLSIEAQWPFIPSDFPNLRKVFITENFYNGNLGGLEGADKICEEEAKKLDLKGSWKAFLGDDEKSAKERLKLDGIFVDARSAGTLPAEKNCHRLLGKDFNEFFQLLKNQLDYNKIKLEQKFIEALANVWLGRIDSSDKKECLMIGLSEKDYNDFYNYNYSLTTTCQNWKSNKKVVEGYPPTSKEITNFPKCYTPKGARIDAVFIAGVASDYIEKEKVRFITTASGKSCDTSQRLICIQQ